MKYAIRIQWMLGLMLALSSGCSRQDSVSKDSAGAASTNRASAAVSRVSKPGVEMGLDDMEMDDVIVSVNGVVLTKRMFVQKIKRDVLRYTRMSDLKDNERTAMVKAVTQRGIPRFVETQLLVQEARRLNLLSEKEVRNKAEVTLKQLAGLMKQPENVFLGTNTLSRGMQQDVEESVLAEALLDQNASKKISVTEKDVQTALDAIQAENDKIVATNAMKVARLNAIRKAIVVDGADFGKLADQFSECPRSGPGVGGYWGEFERNEIQDLKMRAGIFSLKLGDISEVLEDEEGFHLVKVLAVNAPEKNAKGVIVNPESFKLAHIMLAREPMLIMPKPADIRQQLEGSFHARLKDECLAPLKEKAVIVYPHGTNFWALPKLKLPAPERGKQPVKAPPAKSGTRNAGLKDVKGNGK